MGKRRINLHVALLTGRAGSTIQDKNYRIINGRPMCAYPCAAANMSGIFDETYCSSNDKIILDIASAYGFKAVIRPDEFATSTAQHRDVIDHFLKELLNDGLKPSRITVLMANSATISPADLIQANNLLDDDQYATSAVPVIEEQDHHPFRAKKLVDGALTSYFNFDTVISTNRQQLPKNYFLTHTFWTIRLTEDGNLPVSNIAQPWTFLGNKCLPVHVASSIDVHSEQDFEKTLRWLEDNQKLVF